uniref:Putative nucleolar protein 8 n=1 Tax=Amblyomma aureolatum TaxID=187763 RepID=A0A1E1XC01_9ACAR
MKKRLFVGNLGSTVTGRDLKEKFARFGDVDNVELHTKKDESGKPFKTFAYVDLDTDQEKLVNCIKTYNSAKWKGSDIVVQVAKESYIQRIQREAKACASRETQNAPADSHAELAPPKKMKQEKLDWTDRVRIKTEKPDWTESDRWTSQGPHPRGQQQATPGKFAEEKALLFDDQEQLSGGMPPVPAQCPADVALLRHAWGHRLGCDDDDLEVVPASPEQEREAKRQMANAKRLASLKERFAQSHLQRRLLQSALCSVDGTDRKRRIVFEDSGEEEPCSAGQGKLALFGNDEEEEGNGDLQDFRLRPQFEGHRGHKVLELQSRFAADDRFRLSERFLESDGEESSGSNRDAAHDASAGDTEPLDSKKERTRNLDILRDVLGPDRALHRAKPIFKDATQLRFDPDKDSAAKFEIKPEPKQKMKKKKEQEEAAAVPQVSSEQFYEVTGSLHDALASRSGGFSLAQMFTGQLQDDDLQADPFDGSGSSEDETSDQEQAKYHSHVQDVCRKKAAPQEFFHTDTSLNDVAPPGRDTLRAVAREVADKEGEMSKVFKRMDDHRFAAVVDRPRFFFVPNDRRLLEGAKFFRCQSDPETIRNNFFDGKTALVKLMLSKRKMAKRALERKHGKKVGSQQWRLGKLRKK